MTLSHEPQIKVLWLEQFVLLCQQNDFLKAAQKLNLSRQTLQRNIGLLEKAVKVDLIQRNGKDFLVTPRGRLFYAEAQQLIHTMHQFSSRFKQHLTGPLQGSVALAWQSWLSFRKLAQVLQDFIVENPDVFLETQLFPHMDDIEALLLDNRLDIAVVDYLPAHEHLIVHKGLATPYVIVSCPQPQRHWSTFSYINNVYHLPSHLSPPWNDALHPRTIVSQTNNINMLLQWTQSGVAAFIPLTLAQPYLEMGQLAIVAEPPEAAFAHSYLCVSADCAQNPVAQLLIEQLQLVL
jgi:DNA-binding transcriptional LysR family regulator